MPILIALSGMPGVGKTSIARAYCEGASAIHLRVDSVEVAIKTSALKIDDVMDAGYSVLAALTKDNLRLGFDVVVDTVNPLELTRQMWGNVASESNAKLLNVEIVCSDKALHRNRVENRIADISGHDLPTWKEVQTREFTPWNEDRLVLDTTHLSTADCVEKLREFLKTQAASL